MAEGADGITALNLVLPVYSLIFAVGAMIGVGIGDPVQDPQGAGATGAQIRIFPMRCCGR